MYVYTFSMYAARMSVALEGRGHGSKCYQARQSSQLVNANVQSWSRFLTNITNRKSELGAHAIAEAGEDETLNLRILSPRFLWQ